MSRQLRQLRQISRRAPRATPPQREPEIDPIARIDALTATGRANWLALLAYLTFALVTTLGVEDIDFFVDSRQTQLPLVNVSIPTFSFFIFAPILGAALYAYLHLHVRKVSEALAVDWATPPRLEERIKPWLLNDFVLRQRKDRDRVIRRRPLDWLAGLTTLYLVWWAGPLVFALMWVRTWPAHELWLSLLCALCLMLSVYAGALSWAKMRQDLDRWGQRATAVTTVITILLCLPVLWLTTANSEGIGEIRGLPLFELDAPDLTAARLSVLPPEEADLDTARHRYRMGFCERRGIDAEICDRAPSAAYDPPAHLVQKRQKNWCDPRGYVDGAELDCAGFFAGLDADFDREWRAYRAALIASIAKPDLRGKDLRRALLAQAELSGIDLHEAQMEGADLSEAQMEGADLSEARMEGANLLGARMEGADLSGVRMAGADLSSARMEGADLSEARMEGADLRWALMEGANLFEARMEGANLLGARMAGADIGWVLMEGVDLVGAQMEVPQMFEAQMEGAQFGLAWMEGANLVGAQLQSVEWAGGTNSAAPAHSTDFRGSETLTQVRLSQMIGSAETLLPDMPDSETSLPLYIPSCWEDEPDGWATLVGNLGGYGYSEADLEAEYICSADRPLCKTGTPWPLDEPPPDESELRQPYDCVPVE